MLERVTTAVLRHRRAVIVSWLLVGLLGIYASVALPDRLTALTSVPGSQSAEANALLSSRFGENDDGSFTIVYAFKNATPAQITTMQQELTAAVSVLPHARVLQQRALAGTLFAFVSTDMTLLEAANATKTLRTALKQHGLTSALVTGPPALEHDVRPVLADDLRRGTALAVFIALLLLTLALGWGFALIVPFAVAAGTVAAALSVMLLVAHFFTMVLYIPNVIELIGLGLAIDYSLLVVHRFRRELAASSTDEDGNDVHTGIETTLLRTMATAGRTVALSGLTAAVGLSVLFLVPVPFVRSLGAAGLVVPALAVCAALTLQPVLLSLLGERGVTPRGIRGLLASESAASGWRAMAARVQRHPRRTLVAGLLVLAVIAAPAAWLRVAPASLTSLPANLESARGVAYLSARIGPGGITPHSVIVDLRRPGAARSAPAEAARNRFAAALSKLPESFAAVTDTNTLFIDPTGQYQRFLIVGRHGFEDAATQALVTTIRAYDLTSFGYPAGARVIVGGAPAQGVDFLQRVYGSFPWIVLASLLLAYLLMVRAFRSRAMPLIAVLLNLLSVAAAVGAVSLVFRFGIGAGLIGATRTDYLESWSLVFLFAMLFGLSMDYQVFLVSRIRESRDAGLAMADAVADALAQTGAVITLAAVTFVGALTGLVFGHISGLQELGVGLGLGVLIDATIVRVLILPSAFMLLDRSS